MKNNADKLLEGFLRSLSQTRRPSDDSGGDHAPGGPGDGDPSGIGPGGGGGGCPGPLPECPDGNGCFPSQPNIDNCGSMVKMNFLIQEVRGIGHHRQPQRLDFLSLKLQAFVQPGHGSQDQEHCRPCSMPALHMRAYVYASQTGEMWQGNFWMGGKNILTETGLNVVLPQEPPLFPSIKGLGCGGQCVSNKFDYMFTIAYFPEDNEDLVSGTCPKICGVSWLEDVEPIKFSPEYAWEEGEFAKNIAMEPGMCSGSGCEVEFSSMPIATPPVIGKLLRQATLYSTFGFNMYGERTCPC